MKAQIKDLQKANSKLGEKYDILKTYMEIIAKSGGIHGETAKRALKEAGAV